MKDNDCLVNFGKGFPNTPENVKSVSLELKRSNTMESFPSLPNKLSQYYFELMSYIDSFNKRVGNFLESNESVHLKAYQKFADMKMREIMELHEKMDNKVAEYSKKLYEKEIKHNKTEIVMLKAKLHSLTRFFDTLESNYKKLKEKTERITDENKFLKTQVKNQLAETNNLQLVMKSVNEYVDKLQGELMNISNKEEIIQLITNIRNTLNITNKHSLELALEPILKQTPKIILSNYNTNPKRSKSEIKENDYIDKLRSKNELLLKRISFLKAKMASSIYKRSELEEFFIDCINTVKKGIYEKALKYKRERNLKLPNTKSKLKLRKDITDSLKKIKTSMNESIHFSNEDKVDLLTLFVCNDKLVRYIYNFLFPKYEHNTLYRLNL